MSDKKKTLIVDANNCLFRAYCASPNLNANGEHIGGIVGFFYSLQRMIKDVRPHNVYIIWDGESGSKKRRNMNPSYKEGRKVPRPIKFNRAHDIQKTEDEEKKSLYYQQHRVVELLNYFPFIQLCEGGVEADDFISYICHMLSCDTDLKIIMSNDKDFIQLLDKCTVLYRPVKKEYVTYNSFIKNEGINPKNITLSRSIEGDNSDNLVGVNGVGRKTILKTFKEFAEDRYLTINDLIDLCKNKKDNNTANKILENINLIEQNYKIMQLYQPLVSFVAADKINKQIEDFEPRLSYLEFINDAAKDGITGTLFRELMVHSEKMIIDWSITNNEKR